MKETSAGLGTVWNLEGLGVDVNENSNIGQGGTGSQIDASAGRGVASRREVGRIRHIAMRTLRDQKLTQHRKV